MQKQIVIASVREMDCVFFFINYYDTTVPHSLMELNHFLIIIVAFCKFHEVDQSQKFTRVSRLEFWKGNMKNIDHYC